MAAVAAIASAPQNVTRTTAFTTGAPPARADIPPRKARKPSDVIDTTAGMCWTGVITAETSGNAAPMANVAADATAAWTACHYPPFFVLDGSHELHGVKY